jgi:hypothetical protein
MIILHTSKQQLHIEESAAASRVVLTKRSQTAELHTLRPQKVSCCYLSQAFCAA